MGAVGSSGSLWEEREGATVPSQSYQGVMQVAIVNIARPPWTSDSSIHPINAGLARRGILPQPWRAHPHAGVAPAEKRNCRPTQSRSAPWKSLIGYCPCFSRMNASTPESNRGGWFCLSCLDPTCCAKHCRRVRGMFVVRYPACRRAESPPKIFHENLDLPVANCHCDVRILRRLLPVVTFPLQGP